MHEKRRRPQMQLLPGIFLLLLAAGDVAAVGINYGTLGDNLPPPKTVAKMLQSTLIDQVKIYDTNPDILAAFSNTGIDLVVAVENAHVANLTRSPDAADRWLAARVTPFLPATSVVAVAVGNEFLTQDGATLADFSLLVPAMRNLHRALQSRGLHRKIKVSTPHSMGVLASSFPPSSAAFLDELRGTMSELVDFLMETDSPFMINAYPYFAYRDNPSKIDLEYALLGDVSGAKRVHDPKGYIYTNMLDAQIDAVRAAIVSLNRTGGVRVAVSESGWPSRGGAFATPENARAYNMRLISRGEARAGTPMAPESNVDVFVFSLFNEDKKEGDPTERGFGLFNADGTKAYEMDLSCSFCSGEKVSFGGSAGRGGPSVWCLAKPHADERMLQAVLDFCCGPGGVDCGEVRGKGACFEPDKLYAHASYAMNAYYQMHGRNYWNCDFKGIGLVTFSDPSYGSCRYPQQ
ncbi:hypothetical protein H6P81_018406 [Aristolochia fimbriata]|uniref:glucan endo-1,3-beta-D-glucosidase n=1 Tax=Aristolochia fimbriata TaxID=158543 RepID=A0AAV7E1A4_ARIFI|nr:hypothetical protein H6P81_018406 [Aristolochia fimbriata]